MAFSSKLLLKYGEKFWHCMFFLSRYSVVFQYPVRAIKSHALIQDSERSNLLVLLDHPQPKLIFLSYSELEEGTPGSLHVDHQLNLYSKGSRPAEYFTDVVIHPSGDLAVVSCYTGTLKVINIQDGQYTSDVDVMCVIILFLKSS
jgi:hypothetical protein